uniref:Uncharacterized protein n=1 Tax=Periophthalmus magnuspinnatus TaxID=409849 RepID=A0A3B4BE66_9GOBI
MAQISQTCGAPVGKEEALRMEEEALAKLQRGKRQTFPSTASKPAQKPAQKPDLIVFPEAKRQTQETFKDIDVDKLTNEELEKLLLDENFAANRPTKPSLLGFNLSASYPGGVHSSANTFSAANQWTPVLQTPPTASSPSPLYPTAPFPKAGTFQNGFPPFIAPSFIPFTPPALVFPPPAPHKVDPEMVKLFDKIASTKEYLKNGRSATANVNLAESTSSFNMGRFDWLDLDPLTKRKSEADEAGLQGQEMGASEGDPWDAVLRTEGNSGSNDKNGSGPEGRTSVVRRAASGVAVTRSHSLNTHGTSPHKNSQVRHITTEYEVQLNKMNYAGGTRIKLRSRFLHSDCVSNPGFVLSPVIPQKNLSDSASVKVCIEISERSQPVTFTCDVSSPVDLLISQTLCWVHDDLDQVDFSKYLLKVCGQEEVLQNKHSLGSHVYIQNCRKWESDISLQLLSVETVKRDLSRTAEDDSAPIDLDKHMTHVERPFKENVTSSQYKTVGRLVQTVKNLLCALDEVETLAVTEAVKRLQHSANLPRTRSPKVCPTCPELGLLKYGHSHCEQIPVAEGVSALTLAVYDLVKLYLRSFCSPSPSCVSSHTCTSSCTASDDHFEKYFVMCALTHNGKNLFKPIQSKRVGTYKSFFYHVRWDELILFPMAVAVLPLESVLSITLYGVLTQTNSGSPDSNRPRTPPEQLGRVSLPLFDFRRSVSHTFTLYTLDFPCSSAPVLYVPPKDSPPLDLQNLMDLDPDLRGKLEKICNRRSDLQLLWDHRLHCLKLCPLSLPKVLSSAPCWDWASLPLIHSILKSCAPLPPVAALELLDSRFADSEVRNVAVSWIEQSSDDELSDYLPQLVQALKFECHLKNSLVLLLLSRALSNVSIAHYLYWLLKDAVQDAVWGWRYERVLGALLCLCGSRLRAELDKQNRLVILLGAVAERVKAATGSNRQVALQEGLENVQNLFERSSCRLPLSPSLVAKELNIKACSFFNSNAVPLKLALVNADPLGQEINVMFKVGEDLRQDMLALQMIRIMDRIWLQEGLDLRIVHFKCISTGKDKGMVELVPSSDTLRKIQVEYGVTGSFKDKPLAEWLRKYNPAEDEYDKASENFIYSCAGCCVATYVLGICDRHNDNIMLRSTGHMFHIDFGKFLGHAQMFGSFKRDRAPFVLTSDMAYVINGGERPTSRFQLFVDLCCQAYNLLRKNSGLFLNLLSLMTCSGLPELTGAQDLKYVCDALQPNNSDAEATIFFTRLIESSLGSVATKFNFFIHNLAQLRFSGLPANDEPILSFSPKTYSLKQDGRIQHAAIFSFQKRYSPDKHYTYAVRILREGQSEPQFIFRTFDEFQELHTKLSVLFPLWKLPSFPNKLVLGRTHVKDVAAKRKLELNNYVHNLLRSSTEVTQCDLVYTFFHPMARDDKTEGESPPPSPVSGRVEGEVKLSISYRNSTLFIMIMHIRDLVSEEGSDPNPYVKTYLLPDPSKSSKRKTKICRKTRNPTFNEMLVYRGHSKESLGLRELQLSVLSAESLRENYFLGGVTLRLKDFDLSKETVKWYKLTDVPLF